MAEGKARAVLEVGGATLLEGYGNGDLALYSNSTCANNTANGAWALDQNTSGRVLSSKM